MACQVRSGGVYPGSTSSQVRQGERDMAVSAMSIVLLAPRKGTGGKSAKDGIQRVSRDRELLVSLGT